MAFEVAAQKHFLPSVQEVPQATEEEPVVRVPLRSSGRSFAVRVSEFTSRFSWYLLGDLKKDTSPLAYHVTLSSKRGTIISTIQDVSENPMCPQK